MPFLSHPLHEAPPQEHQTSVSTRGTQDNMRITTTLMHRIKASLSAASTDFGCGPYLGHVRHWILWVPVMPRVPSAGWSLIHRYISPWSTGFQRIKSWQCGLSMNQDLQDVPGKGENHHHVSYNICPVLALLDCSPRIPFLPIQTSSPCIVAHL